MLYNRLRYIFNINFKLFFLADADLVTSYFIKFLHINGGIIYRDSRSSTLIALVTLNYTAHRALLNIKDSLYLEFF